MEWEDDFCLDDEQENPQDNWSMPWKVVLQHHRSYRLEHVVYEVQRAIGSNALKAVELALAAHKDGYAVIYEGDFFDCQTVVELIRKARLNAAIYG